MLRIFLLFQLTVLWILRSCVFCCPALPSGKCFIDCTTVNYTIVCEDITSKILHDDLATFAGLQTQFRLCVWNSPDISRLGASIFAESSTFIVSLELQNLPNLRVMVEMTDMTSLRTFIVRNAPLLGNFPLDVLPPSLETIIMDTTGVHKFLSATWLNVLLDSQPKNLNLSAVQEFRIINHQIDYLSEFFTSFPNIKHITIRDCIINGSTASELSKPITTKNLIRSLRLINNTYLVKNSEFGQDMLLAVLKSLSLQPNATLEIKKNLLTIGKNSANLLKSMSNLSHLSLRDSFFDSFSFINRLFENLSDLQSLDLGSTQLPDFGDGIFAGLPKLRELRIDHNNLRNLGQVNLFSGLLATNLSVLDMSNTDIRFLPVGIETAGQNLTELYLRGNYLSSEDFEEATEKEWLSNVRILDLSSNNMQDFDGRVLKRMKNLKTLDISCNKFKIINEQLFIGLPEAISVFNLTICANTFDERPSVPTNAFRTFPPVQKLYMGSGFLRKWIFLRLQRMPTISLARLEELHLPDNKISYLHNCSSYFEGFTGLKYLDLRGNPLQSIGKGTFSSLPNLKRLNLANNALYGIQIGDFEGLTSLEYLDISGNNLVYTENGVLDPLTNLRGLFVADNIINVTNINGMFEKGASQLEHLSIANLAIDCLDPAWFRKFKNIKWIYWNSSLSLFMDFSANKTLEQQINETGVYAWSRIQYCEQPWNVYQERMAQSASGLTFFRLPVMDAQDAVYQNVLANFVTCHRPGPRRIESVVTNTICPKPVSL